MEEIAAQVDHLERAIGLRRATHFSLPLGPENAVMSVPASYTETFQSPPASLAASDAADAEISVRVCEPVCVSSKPVVLLGPSPEDVGGTINTPIRDGASNSSPSGSVSMTHHADMDR